MKQCNVLIGALLLTVNIFKPQHNLAGTNQIAN